MGLKQLELWPGHTEWATTMGKLGHSTHVEVSSQGRLRVRVKFGRPDAKEGHTPEHTVSTPEGNYKIPTT